MAGHDNQAIGAIGSDAKGSSSVDRWSKYTTGGGYLSNNDSKIDFSKDYGYVDLSHVTIFS